MLPFVRGGNYGATRAALETIGPLPEDIFPCEDLSLSATARRAGVEITGLPEAVVHYRYRAEPSALWRQGYAYGQARCRIVRDLIDHGEERPGRFAGWRSWIWLLGKLPSLRSSNGRANWVWVAANRIGQLRGSITYRVWHL